MKSNYFYTALIAFLLGVAFETISNATFFLLLFTLLISISIAAEWWVFSLRNGKRPTRQSAERRCGSVLAQKPTILLLASWFILFFFLGALRYETYEKNLDPILTHTRGTSAIVGVISEDPDVRPDKEFLTVRVISINGDRVFGENNILIQTGLLKTYTYGDEVDIFGALDDPRNFSDEATEETFDYVSYLQKDRIYFVMYDPSISVLAHGKGDILMAFLFSVKHAFMTRIQTVLPEPNASLVSAIILGDRHGVPEDILNILRTVGIIHIVILSGYAITIVAESVRRFFARLGLRTSVILASISIILFALMTGASAMVVRASIMALLAFLSKISSRRHDAIRALALTIALMILWNPMTLGFDTSFQISVIAVVGLIYVSPIFEQKFIKIPEKYGLREIFLSTLSAQIAVLPYLLYLTGTLSLFAIPANLLVLPVLPLTMLFGLLSGLFGFISSIIAFPFAAITYALTSYEFFVAKFFSAIPFSSLAIPLPLWIVILVYFVAALKLFSMTSQLRFAKKSSM